LRNNGNNWLPFFNLILIPFREQFFGKENENKILYLGVAAAIF
jgi:hypothetical protein